MKLEEEEEEKEAEGGGPQSDYLRMSKLVEFIFDAVTMRVDLDTWLYVDPLQNDISQACSLNLSQ